MEFKIYVINATEYDESGKEHGVWLELPMTCNELDATLDTIGVSAVDNYIIMDVETNLPFEYPIDEYASLAYLNSLAMSLAEIELKGDLEWVAAYIEATGDSLEATLDSYENHSTFHAGQTLANVAWNKAHAYFDAYRVPECISRYFDYDALEADLEQDGYYEADGGTIEVY